MENKFSVFKYVVYISQLGISLILPVVLCVLLGTYIKNKFELGDWVMLVSILLGISVAARNFYVFMLFVTKKAKESEEKHK